MLWMLFLAALFPVLKEIRKNLRFGLSDRVLCNCGPLWLSGGIVGSAVESEGELFPYVVTVLFSSMFFVFSFVPLCGH